LPHSFVVLASVAVPNVPTSLRANLRDPQHGRRLGHAARREL